MNYVDFLSTRFENIILLTSQYKYAKIVCAGSEAPGSDPPHRIVQYCCITQPGWLVHFYLTQMVERKYSVPIRYQLPQVTSAGLALIYCT